MTIIKGEIESLKRIKEALKEKGITRFNSLGNIKHFLNNYEVVKREILNKATEDLVAELKSLEDTKTKLEIVLEKQQIHETSKLNDKIAKLESKCKHLESLETNALQEILNISKAIILKLRIKILQVLFHKIIQNKIAKASLTLKKTHTLIHEYRTNKEKMALTRCENQIKKLDYIKEVVDGLDQNIAGAVGENLVVKELEKLSDNNFLINDFAIDFNPPMYNKKENDRIYSIQIDHLLVTNAGIFIIETKNWSKKSIENLNLRSPIKQINRFNYALYLTLNGNTKKSNFSLTNHHWGKKQIPIRNLVVMINHKPKEAFKFVQVKTLKELNSYLSYFEPILNDSEVKEMVNYLDRIRKRPNGLSLY